MQTTTQPDIQPNIQTDFNELLLLRTQAQRVPMQQKQRANHSLSGVRLAKILGRGLEFDQVRQYQAGDDLSCMDWKVTARTNKPHIKQYRQERERPVIIIVDQRRSMFFGSKVRFKSVQAAHIAALCAWLAVENQERVGGAIITDENCVCLPAKASLHNTLAFLKSLSKVKPLLHTNHTHTLSHALKQCLPLITPHCLVILLSDFQGIDPQVIKLLQQYRTRAEVVAGLIYDPLEKDPPKPGIYPITNGEQVSILDLTSEKQQKAYKQHFVEHFNAVAFACRQAQIPLHALTSQHDLTRNPLTSWLAKCA